MMKATFSSIWQNPSILKETCRIYTPKRISGIRQPLLGTFEAGKTSKNYSYFQDTRLSVGWRTWLRVALLPPRLLY